MLRNCVGIGLDGSGDVPNTEPVQAGGDAAALHKVTKRFSFAPPAALIERLW